MKQMTVVSEGGKSRRISETSSINFEFSNREIVTVYDGNGLAGSPVIYYGKAGKASAYLAKHGIDDGTKTTEKF